MVRGRFCQREAEYRRITLAALVLPLHARARQEHGTEVLAARPSAFVGQQEDLGGGSGALWLFPGEQHRSGDGKRSAEDVCSYSC